MNRVSAILMTMLISLGCVQDSFAGPAATASDLESFFGLPNQTFNSVGNGSAIQGSGMTFTVNALAGDTLSFHYNFLTTEGPGGGFDPINDFAFIHINPLLTTLADTYSPRLSTQTSYAVESGDRYYSTTFTQSGAFTIGLGVLDVIDDQNDSALLVDDFRLSGTPLTNGSFETGSFGGFSTLGNVSLQSSAFGAIPADGNLQALLTTSINAVPEPSSVAMFACGFGALLLLARRKLAKVHQP